MVVVLNHLALDITWQEVQKLGVVSGGHESVIAASEEQHLNVCEVCLEVGCVVNRWVVLSIGDLVQGGVSEVELLEVAGSDHLDPVQEVLGGGASDVVAAHHGEHSKIEVLFLVEADHSLDDVPDKAGEGMQESWAHCCELGDVQEAV